MTAAAPKEKARIWQTEGGVGRLCEIELKKTGIRDITDIHQEKPTDSLEIKIDNYQNRLDKRVYKWWITI